jgi:hypothetical protein
MIWSLDLIEHGVPKSQYTVAVQRKCTKTSLVLTFSEFFDIAIRFAGAIEFGGFDDDVGSKSQLRVFSFLFWSF